MIIEKTEYTLNLKDLNPKRHNYNMLNLKNLYKKYDKKIIDKEISLLTIFYIYHDKNNTDLDIIFELITDKGNNHNEINISDYYNLCDFVHSELEINQKIRIRRIKRELIKF